MLKMQKLTKSLGFKLFLVGILVLIMLIPVTLVVRVIQERARRADSAEYEIIDSWGGALEVAGPVLKIPCVRVEEERITDEEGHESVQSREVPFTLWIMPGIMEFSGDFRSEEKSRGIFSVPVFQGLLRMDGSFELEGVLAELKEGETPLLEEAEIILALENQKGIRKLTTARLADSELEFTPGDSGFGLLSGGIRAAADLPESGAAGTESVPFSIAVEFQGGRSLRLLPLAGETYTVLTSDWTAPSYQGNFLPMEQTLDEEGFEARWQISNLSRGIPLAWEGNLQLQQDFTRFSYGVDFLEVLDLYAKNERAAKYTILFILVPFLTLFLFEVFYKMSIHPVQYLLAGMAGVIFYLLLLSLSEHISFNGAYFLAAGGVTLMMFLFSWSLMKSPIRGILMVPVMIVSYTYLFITLQSEDWALLIGSIGSFLVLGLVMFITRNVDWYGTKRIDK